MNSITIEQPFPLVSLDQEYIQSNVYLGDNEKNIELFNALSQGQHTLNKLLPNHFENLNKCCRGVSAILHTDDPVNFSFEKDIRSGFPFLMLENYPLEGAIISNKMNYASEQLTHIEASMVMNALAYCYLYETSEYEVESEFCAFMLDYLKILASHNYKTEGFNSSAFYKIID